MRHSAANQNHILLLRKVTLIGILHCCEAHKGCSGTLPLQFQTAPQATAAFCRSAQFNYLIRLLRQNVRSRRTFLSLFALVWRRRTYRVGAADISLLRGSNVRLSLTYIRAKISRPEQGRISSLIAHCALAQDIIHTLYASYFLNGHSSAPSDSRCLISSKKGFAPNSSLSRAPS